MTRPSPLPREASIGLFRHAKALASAQGHFVHVYVDRAGRRPTTLPDRLRTALVALLAEG